MIFVFFSWYGDHRDLPVLTHSFPTLRSSDLDLSKLPEGELHASWYNPRDGTCWPLASMKQVSPATPEPSFRLLSSFTNNGNVQEFKPHSAGRGSDWVLVITTPNE